MLQTTASGTRPQPNSETLRYDEAERTESGSSGKEHVRPENEYECPESENDQLESAHGRIAPDDQVDDNGCT
jgi:hypothetical protein